MSTTSTPKITDVGLDFARTPYGTLRASGNEIRIHANFHQLLDWREATGDVRFKDLRKLIAYVNTEDPEDLPRTSPEGVDSDALAAWIDDVIAEATALAPKRRWRPAKPAKKQTREELVAARAGHVGLVIATRIGEDNIKRVRFGLPTDYGSDFDEMNAMFTALGIKEAEIWLTGFLQGKAAST